LNFLERLYDKNFINIHPVAAELFHADGQTDGRTDRQTWWNVYRTSSTSV